MPRLESLLIVIPLVIHNRDAEIQFTHRLGAASISPPNLGRFMFRSPVTHLKIGFHRITAPRLEEIGIKCCKNLRRVQETSGIGKWDCGQTRKRARE